MHPITSIKLSKLVDKLWNLMLAHLNLESNFCSFCLNFIQSTSLAPVWKVSQVSCDVIRAADWSTLAINENLHNLWLQNKERLDIEPSPVALLLGQVNRSAMHFSLSLCNLSSLDIVHINLSPSRKSKSQAKMKHKNHFRDDH